MLCKLSLANIKKSIKDYAIYFVTLVLGVCIFYIFNSIDSQSAMLTVNSRQSEMIELLVNVLSYVSVFVTFILGFLIIYASRFLIKKRNKEFGIYMTLGMSKRKISLLLLLETFIIGLISLAVGLFLGVVLSQVTSVFVANMFEADMTKYVFVFSSSAMIKTAIYFAIIYLIVMIFNTIVVSKNKLINLLQASKRGENLKIKNPYICILLFIVSVLMLASAYYMVTGAVEELTKHEVGIILLPRSLGVVGTLLFFYSVSGMILKAVSRCKNFYSRGLNTFIIKQINSKINTMVVSISVICIMLFLTLCLLSSSLSLKNYFNNSINKYAPVDLNLYEEVSEGESDIDKFLNEPILKNNIKDKFIVNSYTDSNFRFSDSLGDYAKEVPNLIENHNVLVKVVGEKDYNLLADYYNLEKVSQNENEYTIVVDFNKFAYDESVKRNTTLHIFDRDLVPSKKGVIEGFMEIGSNPSNMGFVVVKDDLLADKDIYSRLLLVNYSTSDKETIEKIEKALSKIDIKRYSIYDTKKEIRESSSGLTTIITFICLYVGVIFLISSSAILALKELSDCIDDRDKYRILRQIGVEEKDINKALFKQTLIFFMTPLILAIVHTIFGLKFAKWVLGSMGVDNMLSGVIMTFVFLLIIYLIYFIVTYLCNKSIIRD